MAKATKKQALGRGLSALLKDPANDINSAEDKNADLCDLVPLYFIQHGKTNLTMKRYLRLEHNFFELTKSGKTNYEKPHWPEVMNTFLMWLNKN